MRTPLWQHELGAENRQQGLRHCRHVALSVHHRKMRGAGRRQLLGAQRAPAVGIAHTLQAFLVGRLQRQSIGSVCRRTRPAARGLQVLL
jgi:hypothetical protein